MSPQLQSALDAIGPPETLIHAKCRGLMRGYHQRWKNQAYVALSLEEPFHLPIINPETGKPSRTFTHAGKFDGIIEDDGRTYLLEHKTTSDSIEDPNATYWRQLAIDSQVSGYMLACWQQGRKLDGTLYDVIKKPGIRPKSLTKQQQKLLLQDGTYCGNQVAAHERAATEETLSMYEMRLTAECRQNPHKYFQRKRVQRLDHEIVEFASELWDVSQAIRVANNSERHYRNSAACMTWGSPCEYLGVCSGHDTIDSNNWQRADDVHEELPVTTDDGGRDVLTCSRVKCFQLCRRKHDLRYRRGIRRRDDEEREAIYFGRVMHQSLEAWWGHFRRTHE